MTDELVAFVRAALDEDERVAREAGASGWSANLGFGQAAVEDDAGRVVAYDEGNPNDQQAQHIARWDPARVLAEVEAKRRILDDLIASPHFLSDREWYGCQALTEGAGDGPDVPTGKACTCGRDEDVRRRVTLLAQPYAGQPGWREEWRLTSGS